MTEFVDMRVAALRLLEADNILILSHKSPDGDTIGCAGGLFWILKGLGKQAAVLCGDTIPAMYSYMEITPFTGQFNPGFVVAVDVASQQLLGDNPAVVKYGEYPDLCIDHHSGNTGFANATLLDPKAAAAAEIIALLIQPMGARLTPRIADCLYTGLSTDTGCFKFASTTARTHALAARMIEAGANVADINSILFENRSRSRVEIERLALESLTYYMEGACAMICLTKEQIAESGVAAAELEDLTSLPSAIEKVKVGVTLRQQPGGSYRVSIRTMKGVDACAIAGRLGGGGHSRAAGCELEGNLDSIRDLLLDEIAKELDGMGAKDEAKKK